MKQSKDAAMFAAALQNASTSGKPVLMKVNYNGEHGVGGSLSDVFAYFTEQFAFILWQCGIRIFNRKSK